MGNFHPDPLIVVKTGIEMPDMALYHNKAITTSLLKMTVGLLVVPLIIVKKVSKLMIGKKWRERRVQRQKRLTKNNLEKNSWKNPKWNKLP